MLMPAGMTILTRAAGPQRVGRVMAIMGIPMLMGPIVGPILGGWLVDDVSWRWIFFINVPIGLFALVCSLRVLPKDEPQPSERLDVLGLVLLSPSLALMIYGLAQTNAHGFGSAAVLVPALVGLALMIGFIRHALHKSNPLIDLRLFLNRTFTTASVTLVLMVISVFGAMLLLPLYFQAVRGESALQSGLLLAPQGIGAMLTMPLAGNLTDKTGIGKIVIPGIGLIALSTLGLTQLQGDTSYLVLSADLFVMGMGMGFAMMPLFSGAMQTLRKAAVARASTTLNILQQVAASIGTAVMSVILTHSLTSRLPGAPAGGGLGESGKNLPAAIRDLMADAFGHTYIWATALVVVALGAAFFLPRQKPAPIAEDEPGGDESAAPVLIHA
jgi:EmrB/QacA subfamily drug resistance transporter